MKQKEVNSPFFADLILKVMTFGDGQFHIRQEFNEEFSDRVVSQGIRKARFWYWFHLFISLPLILRNSHNGGIAMLKNYLLIAFRTIRRNKVYSAINIFGLSVGIAACIIVILFVGNEMSFDKFHENLDRLYRVQMKLKLETGAVWDYAEIKSYYFDALIEEMPEIESSAKIERHNGIVLSNGDSKFNEDIHFVEGNFLKIFSFPLLRGDAETVLDGPLKAVITEKLAEKFFGDDDPIGKILTVDNEYNYEVTGVMKDIPLNSSLNFEFLVSFTSLRTVSGEEEFNSARVESYLLLRENINYLSLQERLLEFTVRQIGEEKAKKRSYYLHPMSEQYFKEKLALEYNRKGDIQNSVIYSIIAFLILAIACINFMNLTTARASKRAKEVGLRKVVGAKKIQLVKQYIGESVVMSLLALCISLLLVYFFLPYFNSYTGKILEINFIKDASLFGGIFILTLLIGFISGIYPAFFVSTYRPVDVLSASKIKGKGGMIRKSLVVFQFAVSIVFITGVVVILNQIDYLQNKDLGFEKDNIYTVSLYKDNNLRDRIETIKAEMLQNPDIIDVMAAFTFPGLFSGIEMKFSPEGFQSEDGVNMEWLDISYDYLDFFGITVVEGRNFMREMATDTVEAVLVNEKAVEDLGWKSPLGKFIDSREISGKVIGVVKNFHTGPLYEEIKPTVFSLKRLPISELFIKYRDGTDEKALIEYAGSVLNKFAPQLIVWGSYFEETLNNKYKKEDRTGNVYKFSSFLSIFLACLGLYGLASFTVENRKKEIGIRKVLGASVSTVIKLISIDFVKLVVIANVIAWPTAYVIMSKWLESFPYRIEITIMYFLLPAVIAVAITLFTVSFQSVKAALINPVNSLRNE
ncbi:MAG: FtsX-like permease family protein [bacterium]|nr:FtsX-like permease family protein [bacterium]